MQRPSNPLGNLLSILVPIFNEAAHFEFCIERILLAPLPKGMKREVILVDDASTDGTADLVRAAATRHPDVIHAFFQPSNQGKGAAIRRAIGEMHGDCAVFQDADSEYDPRDYTELLRPILEDRADVVYGSRFAGRQSPRVMSGGHALGNVILTRLSNRVTGLHLTDMETCYKAFRADVLKKIPLRSNRFAIEPEITAKIARRQCRVLEVPIRYQSRTYGEGKKIRWRDGLSALYTIFKYGIINDSGES